MLFFPARPPGRRASLHFTAGEGEAQGEAELCTAQLLFWAPPRPQPHPAVPLTSPSFPNPHGTNDKEPLSNPEPPSGLSRRSRLSFPKRQVSQWKSRDGMALSPQEDVRGEPPALGAWALPFQPAQPPPSALSAVPLAQPKAASGCVGLEAPGPGGRTPAHASGCVGLSLLICKMGINPVPSSKNYWPMRSSLAQCPGFPERNLLGLVFLASWFGELACAPEAWHLRPQDPACRPLQLSRGRAALHPRGSWPPESPLASWPPVLSWVKQHSRGAPSPGPPYLPGTGGGWGTRTPSGPPLLKPGIAGLP